MRWSPVVVVVVLSSCVGKVTHDEAIEFGDVAPFSETTREFVVRNEGSAPIELLSSVDSSRFSVDEASVTIPAGQSATLHVHLSSAGPGDEEGLLRLHTTESYAEVPLRGRAVGPLLLKLDANELDFGEVPLLTDGKTDIVSRSLALKNLGNEAALLEVSIQSDEVCVGHWLERVCVPWAPVTLGPGQSANVPVEFRALRSGERRWRLSIALGTSRSLSDAFANVVEYEPCHLEFSGPELSLTGSVPLTVTHVGSKSCRIESVVSFVPQLVALSPRLMVPHTLDAGEPWTITLQLTSQVEGLVLAGTQFHTYEGTSLFVNRSLGWSTAACLSFGSEFDLGVVNVGCNSELRAVQVYNVCPMAVTVDSVVTTGSAFTWLAPSTPTIVAAMTPFSFSVRASPSSAGPQRGSIGFTIGGRTRAVNVSAAGVERPLQRDNFHMPQKRTNDLALAIDSSPSFVSRRPQVRTQLIELFRGLRFSNCFDWKVSMVAAEAGASWLANDAGQTAFFVRSDGGQEAMLEAFDRMPVSTENESCVDALSGVVPASDAGQFVYCVTDADEHSTNVAQQLAALKQRRSIVYWHTVGAFGPDTCGAEAPDAGVQREVLALMPGAGSDICSEFWWPGYGSTGDDCERSQFWLQSGADPASAIQVFVNGQRTAATDSLGNQVWTYDATNGSVSFTTPPMSQSLEIEYFPTCR